MYLSYRNYKGINDLCVAQSHNGKIGTSQIDMAHAIANCKRKGGK